MTETAINHAYQYAADLFAGAARHPAAGIGTRLACLAAEAALGVPGRPVAGDNDTAGPDQLIIRALRLLGRLPAAEFDDPRVLAAARHARAAMRERS